MKAAEEFTEFAMGASPRLRRTAFLVEGTVRAARASRRGPEDAEAAGDGTLPDDSRVVTGAADAGVAQWQSPSLPSWPCGFDSRRPLRYVSPGQRRNVSQALAPSAAPTCPACH
jgi:hypothetical protein